MLCWYAGVLQQLLCCCDVDTAGRLSDHGVSIPQGMLACAYISTGWRLESSLRQANLLVCARCIASWAGKTSAVERLCFVLLEGASTFMQQPEGLGKSCNC